MELLGIAGSIAFSIACAVVGVRLLWLARRTRHAPELAMGVAFASSGAVGFTITVAADLIRRSGGDPALVGRLSQAAMIFFFLGYLGLSVGSWRIFRPRESWPRNLVIAIGAVLACAALVMISGSDLSPGSRSEVASWIGIGTGSCVFAWAGTESFLLFAQMRKRLRLGLVEFAVVDRVRLWGVGMFGAWAMTAHALVYRVTTGTSLMPDGQRLMSSGFGLVAAIAIWLAFFPPAFYRRRFAAAASA
jgi:hypothetical protein